MLYLTTKKLLFYNYRIHVVDNLDSYELVKLKSSSHSQRHRLTYAMTENEKFSIEKDHNYPTIKKFILRKYTDKE